MQKPARQKISPAEHRLAVARSREGTTAITGHYAVADARAFRGLAALQGKDVQQLLAEAINLVFEKYAVPNRVSTASGRRTRGDSPYDLAPVKGGYVALDLANAGKIVSDTKTDGPLPGEYPGKVVLRVKAGELQLGKRPRNEGEKTSRKQTLRTKGGA